jgi:hypothetical protein
MSRSMLKSPSNIHGRSCIHATMQSSRRNSVLYVLSVGPYTLVSINWNLRLLVSTVVVEYVRLYDWLRVIEGFQAVMVPPLDLFALL